MREKRTWFPLALGPRYGPRFDQVMTKIAQACRDAAWIPHLASVLLRVLLQTPSAQPRTVTRELADLKDSGFFCYINLDSRTDRRKQFEQEIARTEFPYVRRFPAKQRESGALGCALSHQAVIRLAIQSDASFAVIFEDDVQLVTGFDVLASSLAEFLNNDLLDVFCVGNKTAGLTVPVSRNLSLANDIQTTSFYVVKRGALEALLRSATKSVSLLAAGGPVRTCAVDIVWKELQAGELNFCVPRKRLATQRPSHSDVAKKWADYSL